MSIGIPIVGISRPHNGNSYTGKIAALYWIRALVISKLCLYMGDFVHRCRKSTKLINTNFFHNGTSTMMYGQYFRKKETELKNINRNVQTIGIVFISLTFYNVTGTTTETSLPTVVKSLTILIDIMLEVFDFFISLTYYDGTAATIFYPWLNKVLNVNINSVKAIGRFHIIRQYPRRMPIFITLKVSFEIHFSRGGVTLPNDDSSTSKEISHFNHTTGYTSSLFRWKWNG